MGYPTRCGTENWIVLAEVRGFVSGGNVNRPSKHSVPKNVFTLDVLNSHTNRGKVILY
jgi:hypothetical protein